MGSQKSHRVIVSDRIYVRLAKNDPKLFLELSRPFEHKNPTRFLKEKLGIFAKDEPHTIVTWERSDDPDDPDYEFMTFPRGGMARVRKAFDECGVPYEVEDARCSGIPDVPKLTHQRTLYDHQKSALASIMQRENCLLRSPTGSGKTTTVFAAICEANVAALVVVPNRVLFDQWIVRASDELGLSRREIGQVRGGKFILKPVTIGIQKSVAINSHDEEFRNYFGMIVADEVDLFAAKTFFAAIDPFPARYRIGVSADHRRKDRKEFLVHDNFGEVVADIDHAALVASGHVLDVELRVIPTEFTAPWYGKRDEDEEASGEQESERANYDTDRLLKEMAADGDRNRLIIRYSRELLAQGDQIFVLAHHREHCMTIEQVLSGMGTKTGLLIGGDDFASIFAETCVGLSNGSVQCGVGTYQAVARGLDIPRMMGLVCATPIASNEQLVKQSRGRVCRTSTGKSGARMIYFWDQHVFPKHLANLARWNKNTVVLHMGAWVPAKQWLKTHRAA